MRVAYLSTHYPSVSHTFIQGEITALEATGIEVLPIALNAPGPGDVQTDLDRAERDRTLYVKAIPRAAMVRTLARTLLRHPGAVVRTGLQALASGRLDLGAGAKAVLQLLEAVLVWDHCQRHGVHAIHAHFGQAPASVAWWVARLGNAIGDERWTWSVTIHGWHEFVTEDTSRLRDKLTAADLVVCVSDFTRAQVLRIAPRSAWDEVAVVRCGIDLEAFAPRASRPVGSPPLVVVTARLAAEKGHLVLLDALRRLADEGMAVHARIIGDGPLRGEIDDAITRLGLDDVVELTGALPPAEVAAALREADVFCLPTFAEGLPVSLMEAMAVGVPVVTTYISGIPELVVDGETGWVVPAGSTEALSGALRDALTSPTRDARIAAALERVRDRHDRVRNAVELERLLVRAHGEARG